MSKTTTVGSIVEDKSNRSIDREQTCPLLLRMFINPERHNSLGEYSRGDVPANELQVHTWMDATLKELTKLILVVNADLRQKNAYFDFALVYPHSRGSGFRMRDIGTTCYGRRCQDDNKTLAASRFQIGDYVDVAITIPAKREEPYGRRR